MAAVVLIWNRQEPNVLFDLVKETGRIQLQTIFMASGPCTAMSKRETALQALLISQSFSHRYSRLTVGLGGA